MSALLTLEQQAEALAHAQALVRILGGAASPEPPPPSSWVEVWREPWINPLVGGWTRIESAPCSGVDDPGAIGVRTQFGVKDWSKLGYFEAVSMNTGSLVINAEQTGGGWALLSGRLFDHTRPIRAETTIEMLPDPGAWCGLAIWHGEGNYREVGLGERSGALVSTMNAPCYVEELGPVPFGPMAVGIDYDPAFGWEMRIGGVVVYSEPIGYRGNDLDGAPNVGLWFVNRNAEQRGGQSGRVRAVVGPVKVYAKGT